MLDDLIAAYGNRFLVAALGVSLALLCLFVVLWILRNRAPSPFVRGGRNRQPRLQVLDAAAVDTRRRIVLIRRDNIEHLVMIGGPTDIVIESGIGDDRPYLNARPLTQQGEEDQSTLPNSAAQANLAPAEPPAPIITAPAAAVAAPPAEPLARRQPVAGPPKTEPSSLPARPAANAGDATESKPAPTIPARRPEPPMEKPVAATALPMAAAATTVMHAPPLPTTGKPVEPAPTVAAEAATTQPVSRPAPSGNRPMAAEAPAVQHTAQLEPVMSVEADRTPATGDFERIRAEPEAFRTTTVIEPGMTVGTPSIETVRMNRVEPVMANEVRPAARDENRNFVPAEPARTPPPVIDPPAAEELLEAARQRVLAPQPPPTPVVSQQPKPAEPTTDITPSVDASEAPKRDMSDFERVLEEEMALHLAEDPVPAARPATTISPILPETRADRPRPPVSAVLPEGNRPAPGQNPAKPGEEPNLQNEIARIFGEMSASRNP